MKIAATVALPVGSASADPSKTESILRPQLAPGPDVNKPLLKARATSIELKPRETKTTTSSVVNQWKP